MSHHEGHRSAGGRPPADPSGIEKPHDVLAAEEFAVPARDAGPAPPDPTGIRGPHDVLAAEEFAMPARDAAVAARPARGSDRLLRMAALLALAVLVAVLVRRR